MAAPFFRVRPQPEKQLRRTCAAAVLITHGFSAHPQKPIQEKPFASDSQISSPIAQTNTHFQPVRPASTLYSTKEDYVVVQKARASSLSRISSGTHRQPVIVCLHSLR